MSGRHWMQLAIGMVCIVVPIALAPRLKDIPAAGGIFGLILGLTPIIIPSRPRPTRDEMERGLRKVAKEDRLNEEQVRALRAMLEQRMSRRPARMRVVAAVVLFLGMCVFFSVLLAVMAHLDRLHPLLLWWTIGFL